MYYMYHTHTYTFVHTLCRAQVQIAKHYYLCRTNVNLKRNIRQR